MKELDIEEIVMVSGGFAAGSSLTSTNNDTKEAKTLDE